MKREKKITLKAQKEKLINDSFEIVYFVDGNNDLGAFRKVGDLYVSISTNFYTEHELSYRTKFTSRKDARYYCFVNSLKEGKKLENFKTSKYFKYYVERAEKENPELLL